MQVRKIAYVDAEPKEIYRWIDHIIEEVILQHLELEPEEYIDLKVSKYLQEPTEVEN